MATAFFTAGRRCWARALGVAVLMALAGSDASAAISFVKNIGTNSSTSNGTSIAVTVPAGGVAAGNSIILTFAMDPTGGTVSATDPAGNAYAANVDGLGLGE